MKNTVRLRDVAAAAGVDASVVSRGPLRRRPPVGLGRRRGSACSTAASRLEYRPNTAARTLKTARTMAIGLTVPDLANQNYATIAVGA